VRAAEDAGAANDPEAAHYLALARQQVADAERLMRGHQDWTAQRVLERAKVHADLARERARYASARADAEATQQQIARLQSEGQP